MSSLFSPYMDRYLNYVRTLKQQRTFSIPIRTKWADGSPVSSGYLGSIVGYHMGLTDGREDY